MIDRTALAIIRLTVSPIPMGRTPGFLLSAISLQAMRGEMLFGSTRHVQRRLAVAAIALHKVSEADLKEVQSLLHPRASIPEGPAAPSVRRAAALTQRASKDSKITG